MYTDSGKNTFGLSIILSRSVRSLFFLFGDSIDTIGSDDADPFPYNLDEEELKLEVRYSLGLERP